MESIGFGNHLEELRNMGLLVLNRQDNVEPLTSEEGLKLEPDEKIYSRHREYSSVDKESDETQTKANIPKLSSRMLPSFQIFEPRF